VGTIDFKKLHPRFLFMCREIIEQIPDVRFTLVGDVHQDILLSLYQPPPLPPFPLSNYKFTWVVKVDDVAPYLAEMDVFGYPLRSDHYGTCEQVLGEAMAAGLPVMVFPNPAERFILGDHAGVIIPDWEDEAKNEKEYVDGIRMISEQTPEMNAFRKEIGVLNRHRAKELYSLDTMIQRWNGVFEEMMLKPKVSRKPL